MFKRKTIRIKRPPEEFAYRYGSGAVRNPWWKIEQLVESRGHMKEALSALHKQLEEAYRKEILAYLAEHGMQSTRDRYFGRVPEIEVDGAAYLALPKGWTWEHRPDDPTAYHSHAGEHAGASRASILSLNAPNGAEVASISSITSNYLTGQKGHAFKKGDMHMACIHVMRKLLPSPTPEQDAPMGIVGGSNE